MDMDMDQSEQEEDDDPLVTQIIEESVRPFIGRVSPELLDDMRLVLGLFLTTHPEASAVVDSLRERRALSSSGDLVRDPSTARDTPPPKRSGTLGRSP